MLKTRPNIWKFKMTFRTLINSLACVAALVLNLAHADGKHHFAFGSPAEASMVTRTIHVQANDQMRLLFDTQDIRVGDVVRFVVRNTGAVPHEFGIGDETSQRQHAEEMMQMPDMVHADANVVTLKPGETKVLIWSFKNLRQKNLVFACNVPGHYQAGMVLRLHVKP
jgi:uncharacterized cupredoxin-like copper-binding protein